MPKYRVTINVRQLTKDADLDPEDRDDNPSGDYEYIIELAENGRSNWEKELKIEELALDEFHQTIPISTLDDFEITVSNIENIMQSIQFIKESKWK